VKNEACNGEVSLRRSRAKHQMKSSKLRPGKPGNTIEGVKMYYYVYILRSTIHPESHYTGYTTDYKKRLVKHNNGEVPHTSKHKSWDLQTIIAFTEKEKAIVFEKYLKSHSGRAFAKKHF